MKTINIQIQEDKGIDEPTKGIDEPTVKEELTSYDKTLERLLIPIKEYLSTNAPKNTQQENLLLIIKEILSSFKSD